MSIFDRITVVSGWHWELRHCWWRYIVMPIGNVDRGARYYLGYTSFSFFGFAFFWHHELTPEHERKVLSNSKKMLAWVKKNGGKEIK